MEATAQAPRQIRLQDVLATMAGSGDQWAVNEILMLYDKLLRKTARDLLAGMESTTFEDLMQIGRIVLMQLAGKYRIDRGAAFTTFAVRYLPLKIRQMADGDFTDRLVSAPTNELRKDRARLRDTGVAKYRLYGAISMSGHVHTGDGADPISDDDYLATLCPETAQDSSQSIEDKLLLDKVWKVVDTLPAQQRAVLRLYFQHEKTLEDMAQLSGLTRQSMQNYLNRGLATVQQRLGVGNHKTITRPRMKDVRAAASTAGR